MNELKLKPGQRYIEIDQVDLERSEVPPEALFLPHALQRQFMVYKMLWERGFNADKGDYVIRQWQLHERPAYRWLIGNRNPEPGGG